MIDQVFGETTSFFGQVLSTLLRFFLWVAISILRIALPIMLFVGVLIFKGAILFAVLTTVTLWTYWSNLGILHARIQATRGLKNSFMEVLRYGFADPEDLRLQDIPFSVITAVRNTRFYRRFIAFVDLQPTDCVTIQNLMSLGWIAQMLDSGITHVVKLATPLAIQASNALIIPISILLKLFT